MTDNTPQDPKAAVNQPAPENTPAKAPGRLLRLYRKAYAKGQEAWAYWNGGIWRDTRSLWWVNVLKTANISVNTFLSKDMQTQAAALAYRTTLALVPALAMIFAIGRGFGFQKILQDELSGLLPGQQTAISHTLKFVDSYLNQASEGIFVGIGIVFLLYTLYSLLNSVENTFNSIWGVSRGRSIGRKIPDYMSMLLIFPLLMIVSSGISIFLTSALQQAFDFAFMTPLITVFLKVLSWLIVIIFFAGVYMLVPNTKVKPANALAAGVFAGIAFLVLQWLFISGQMYVTKYNAIYGSFSFLPLLFIWLQLTWMMILIGAIICYSSQNIFLYAFSTQINNISHTYRRKVSIAVCALIVQRFAKMQQPLSHRQIQDITEIPPKLLGDVLANLERAGLINTVILDAKKEITGYQPALDSSRISVGLLRERLDNVGIDNFLPHFSERYGGAITVVDNLNAEFDKLSDNMLLTDISIDPMADIDEPVAHAIGMSRREFEAVSKSR